MIDEFIKTFPMALCAAINPVGILILVAVLISESDRIKKSMSFVVGFFVTFFIMGVILLAIIGKISSDIKVNADQITCVIDWIILGLVIVYFGYKIIQKRKLGEQEKIEKQKPATGKSNNWLTYGALYALTDITSLIPYAILLKDVAGTKISFVDKSFSVFLTNIVVVIPLLILPLICVMFPDKSASILKKIKNTLANNKKIFSAIIFLIIVIYLVYKLFRCAN